MRCGGDIGIAEAGRSRNVAKTVQIYGIRDGQGRGSRSLRGDRRTPAQTPVRCEHHAHHRLRSLLPLRRADRHPPGVRRRISRPRVDRVDRQEPRGTRHLGADGHQRRDRSGGREAGVLGRRQHPLDRGRGVGGRALFPADARHAIRQGSGRDARARHPRVLRLPALQSGRRRMGARRQAEVGALEHAPLSVGRGRDRGPHRRGHRRRRAHPADAHPRFQRPVEGPPRAAGAHGAARSDRNRRPLLPHPSRRHDGGLGRLHVAREEEQART